MRVLSLGAGVQSSTVLLMSLVGELEPLDAAIFADTGWEPRAVYEHLEWLTAQATAAGVPVLLASAGNIRSDALRSRLRGTLGEGVRAASMPLYVVNGQGEMGAIRRQCSREYKIDPIRRRLRALMEERGEKSVEIWIGISRDEALRMKPADVKYITHRWPLIEREMTRDDCLRWMESHGYPKPPRSACIGCPYHSDREWREIKSRPDEWEDACSFDEAIRNGAKVDGKLYVHRSGEPLREVDLRTAEDLGQLNMFVNECEGICGV